MAHLITVPHSSSWHPVMKPSRVEHMCRLLKYLVIICCTQHRICKNPSAKSKGPRDTEPHALVVRSNYTRCKSLFSLGMLDMVPNQRGVLSGHRKAWDSHILAACINISIHQDEVSLLVRMEKKTFLFTVQQSNASELTDGLKALFLGMTKPTIYYPSDGTGCFLQAVFIRFDSALSTCAQFLKNLWGTPFIFTICCKFS